MENFCSLNEDELGLYGFIIWWGFCYFGNDEVF